MKSPWLWYGSAGKFATGYLILLGVAIAGQSLTHVYRSDLNWADEGSHYVSGLMVHDYVADSSPAARLLMPLDIIFIIRRSGSATGRHYITSSKPLAFF